jgi:Cu-processing system ATP-binding protein
MAQIARFPDNLSCNELLRLLRDLRGPENDRASGRLIEAFGLAGELDRPLKTLSGGTRQKISATVAMMFDPAILVLDEPTAGLDPSASSFLKDLIDEQRDRGKTIVMTSHIMSEIDELADRIVYLLDGTVRFDDEKDMIKRRSGEQRLDRALVNALTEKST